MAYRLWSGMPLCHAHAESPAAGEALATLEGLLAGQPGDPFLRTVARYVNSRWGFDAAVGYDVMCTCPLWFGQGGGVEAGGRTHTARRVLHV